VTDTVQAGEERFRHAEVVRAYNPVMVLHGPQVFDEGDAALLIETFRPKRVIVAGVMARTAAEESGIPLEYAGVPPSVALRGLSSAFLATRGKTRESGRIFGEIVASHLGEKGLVQVECCSSVVYAWGTGNLQMARLLSGALGFEMLAVTGEKRSPDPASRAIRGCLPGEPVFVNGIVIGHASSDTVVLKKTTEGVSGVSGLIPKRHGLEKLARTGPVDLAAAWCKSGPVRTRSPVRAARASMRGRIVVADHCASDLYSLLCGDVCGVLSIGDDTTAVCGHIASHLGIPVFGIVDDDADRIVSPGFARGSVIVMVREGTDDELGAELTQLVRAEPQNWKEFVDEMLRFLGDRVVVLEPEIV
jgi:hypothetical protein